MTRAMDPKVADAIWAAIEPILPIPDDDHPLGCHNPRVPDRVCFRRILIRLVTGSSWVDIEAIVNHVVSGGNVNTASGQMSSVSGGYTRSATGTYDWTAGNLFETN
jgi:hypothetical protein